MPTASFRLDARLLLFVAAPLLVALVPFDEPSKGGAKLDGDFADPFVLKDGDAYYAYATGWDGTNLQVARSRDLASWARVGDPLPHLPTWAKGEGFTWAPSVLQRSRAYVLYYTARHSRSGFQCIGRASAARPEGPYVDDAPDPLVCQIGDGARLCGSIDPSPFVDDDGRPYLVWKSDENSASCRTTPRIWSQPLTDDGLGVIGAPSALLARDEAWEGGIVEGPSMVRSDGAYFLFYSANAYDSPDYAIGYGTCEGPIGPCAKVTTNAPFVRSSGAVLGPGGQELFRDGGGRTWMAFHAWTAPSTSYATGGARLLRLAPITFARGAPSIGPLSVPPTGT